MTLKKMMAQHEKHAPRNTLKKSFGDGYLLAHNHVYRNIRNAALGAGYKFSTKEFSEYQINKLMWLPKLHQKKIIPYCDNVSSFKKMLALKLGSMDWVDVAGPLKNYILHESSHAVAADITKKNIPPSEYSSKSRIHREQKLVLTLLLEEAFANTCELMARLETRSDVDSFFMDYNNYIFSSFSAEETKTLSTVNSSILFGITFLSYLHSNFLFQVLSDDQFQRSLDLTSKLFNINTTHLPANERSIVNKLFQVGLDLDVGFRLGTNRFYFKLAGLKTEMIELLDFNFMEVLEKSPTYQTSIRSMGHILTAD